MAGIELEINGLKETLNTYIEKKNFFEKELAIASDTDKKFSLLKKLEELEKDIETRRQKLDELAGKPNKSYTTSIIDGNGNVVIQNVSNAHVNIQVGELQQQMNNLQKEISQIKEPTKTKKILFIYSQSEGYSINFGNEIKRIENALKTSERNARDSFDFIVKPSVTADEFLRLINYYKPHIIHFSMHAEKDRGLIFPDDNGVEIAVTAEDIAADFKLLKKKNPHFECAVFSACNSIEHAKQTQTFIPSTVGMNGKIADISAMTFAEGFYETIFDGETDYSYAFEIGIRKIKRDSNPQINAQADIPQFFPST